MQLRRQGLSPPDNAPKRTTSDHTAPAATLIALDEPVTTRALHTALVLRVFRSVRAESTDNRPVFAQLMLDGPYIDSVVMVSKTEATGRNARPVATVATRIISEFTTLRQEMRASAKERVPAGV